jgi:ADP-ribose pyrophosphatase YjhB (NUDIX family)
MEPNWLEWARRLQAIAQNGLTFALNHFDVERYEAIRAIAAEMMAAGSNVGFDGILDLMSQDTGYATPKVDVRAVIFRNDALLLVKERDEERWTLPGGWADVGGSPGENVVREVAEEAGYQVRAIKLLAVYDRSLYAHEPPFPFHVYKLFFQCEIVSGTAATDFETNAVEFFAADQIPPLSLTRVTPAQIDRMFEHRRHPDWPTDFD